MTEKLFQANTPQTVDEAAQMLLSDLLIQQLQTLCQMAKSDFDRLCDHISPYLNEEFNLWQGNNALLNSCFTRNQEEMDPARIILNRVKEILNDFNGFIVLT